MPNLPVISLNSGKLTPLIDARSDVEKYSGGCRECQNVIPLIYGPVTRRPGTKYIVSTKDSDTQSIVVSFIFSSTIAYEVEFGVEYCRFSFEGVQLEDGAGDPIEVITPYQEEDLFQLQFEQSADVMWITHSLYPQAKLSRVAADEFSYDEIVFDKGPFLERNDIAEEDDVTMAITGYTIQKAVVGAAKAGYFEVTNPIVGSVYENFAENKRFYVADSTGNDSSYTVFSRAIAGNNIRIIPNEAVADGTNDGQIMVGGARVLLTASAAIFDADDGHDGALFKLTHKRLQTVTKGSGTAVGIVGEAIDVKGAWTFNTTGHWDATVEIQRMEDGVNWEIFRTYVSTMSGGVGSRNVQKSDVEKADGVQYRIFVSSYTLGTVTADFTVDESTQDSVFRISITHSTTVTTAVTIIPAPDETATKRWAEGSWSGVRGYPTAVTFFEERIIYGFTTLDGRSIWLSRTGKFEEFDTGLLDTDPFALTLPTANRGRWLGALEALAAGISGGEWRIRSNAVDEALTPTNWSMKKQTAWGSTDIQAMEVNEAIIFVDSVARKIREYTWSEDKQKYVSPDLTALAEDITLGGITSMAVQTRPDSILWFTIANSPYLISMTYEREQNVVAWAEHPLGGNAEVESVCVSPGATEDRITLVVKRFINDSYVRYIEEMQPRDWGSNDANAFFVDCGITDLSTSTTINGLEHLEGETVDVIGDGAVQTQKTVSGGSITIDEEASIVHIGFSSEWRVSPMRPDVVTQSGTTHGSIMITPEIVLSLYRSGGVEYGDGTNQRAIDFRTTEPYGTPPALFTGDIGPLAFDGGFTKDVNIVISGRDPLPATVRAIILRTQKTGR